MPASLATVSAILKEIYEPTLQDQLQSETITSKRLERTSEGVTSEVGGKYVTFPLRTKRNHGIGARNELEVLPVPGQQGYQAARIPLKYLYGGIQLSGQTIELAESNTQAFVSALDQEVDGLKSDLAKDYNRQVFGDGSGAIATTTSSTALATILVPSTQYVEVGMIIDVISPAGVVRSGGPFTILSFVKDTSVTLSGTVTPVSGDLLVRTGSWGREITGLKKIVAASGPLYNVDPSTDPYWVSIVDSTSTSVSEGLFIKMIQDIRTLGGKTTLMVSNYGVQRAYFNLLVQQRQYVNTKEFTGGFNGLAFTTDAGEVPMITDPDAPFKTLYFLNEKALKIYREADWHWMDRDGSMWQRVITSAGTFDAYEARLIQYCELGTHRRNSHGVFTNLTEA